ncbi:MAG: hypothetical protein R6W78_00570 [Bacteroidales bacterium]
MKPILIIIFVNAIFQASFSQAYTITNLSTLHDHYTFERSKVNATDQSRYNMIDGSPYLVERFIDGEVIINDSFLIEKVPLRYNTYTDKMEYLDDQKSVLEVNTSGQKFTFKFDNRHFNIVEYINRNDKEHGFLELLVDGEIRLYRKYSVKFEEATKAMGYQNSKSNRFVRQNDIFLVAIKGAAPVAVYSKKELLLKLQQVNPDIELYLKKHELKMSSEKSVIELIEYCNSKL